MMKRVRTLIPHTERVVTAESDLAEYGAEVHFGAVLLNAGFPEVGDNGRHR